MISRLFFTEFKLPTPYKKICNNYSVSKTNFVECLNPHFVFVGYFTHDQICYFNHSYDLEYRKNCYFYSKPNSYAYVTMIWQQRWCWALDYFNNKISFLYSLYCLYSCKIRCSWSFCFSVNVAYRRPMSSKYSTKQHTFAQLSSKQMSKIFSTEIFPHFWSRYRNFRVGIFLKVHPVYTYVCICSV